jgi:hypothetical protein
VGTPNLDDASQRIAVRTSAVDCPDHGFRSLGVETANRRSVDCLEVVGPGHRVSISNRGLSDADDVGDDLYSDLFEQRFCQRPDGYSSSRFARAGALENVARIVEVVLEHPREIRVARTWPGQFPAPGLTLHRHHVRPFVFVFGIANDYGDRAPDRGSTADAGEDVERVLLYLHSGPASVAVAAPGQLIGDCLGRHREPRRKALEDRNERRSVRLTGGQVTQSGHDRNLMRTSFQTGVGSPRDISVQ